MSENYKYFSHRDCEFFPFPEGTATDNYNSHLYYCKL